VERLWRTFGYDSVDDVVVIFDQLRTTQPEFSKRWLLHTIQPPLRTRHGFSVISMPADRTGHSGGQLEGHILLPKTPQVRIVGGKDAAFLVDGTNYDEDGTLETQLRKRKGAEAGSWRIEISPATDAADTLFLVVMLPSSLTSSPAHQVRLLEETDRLGCEIAGPQRTTRWWFSPGRNGLDVEVRDPDVWVFQVQGPRSLDILARACDDGAPDDFRYFDVRSCRMAGFPLIVSRTGWTGELGFEVYVSRREVDGAAVWRQASGSRESTPTSSSATRRR